MQGEGEGEGKEGGGRGVGRGRGRGGEGRAGPAEGRGRVGVCRAGGAILLKLCGCSTILGRSRGFQREGPPPERGPGSPQVQAGPGSVGRPRPGGPRLTLASKQMPCWKASSLCRGIRRSCPSSTRLYLVLLGMVPAGAADRAGAAGRGTRAAPGGLGRSSCREEAGRERAGAGGRPGPGRKGKRRRRQRRRERLSRRRRLSAGRSSSGRLGPAPRRGPAHLREATPRASAEQERPLRPDPGLPRRARAPGTGRPAFVSQIAGALGSVVEFAVGVAVMEAVFTVLFLFYREGPVLSRR